jgi:hypothetical protein
MKKCFIFRRERTDVKKTGNLPDTLIKELEKALMIHLGILV